ncbi:nitronate monooxygenase family protein [Novosphingobium sp. AP12]|uniref:NAD(P)H-dependent flavin oxidoreductase n=1 Tax=Novosphingobium sp. AP12 TaxID=1144305 RepID=UPI0002720FDE|nr:nitronate monooxygenase family protein [Novosphingobium sp. AP12]EJL30474.1 2-nitropropane dioxygenase-like enzyme [Novosphingobium sp. AP12]
MRIETAITRLLGIDLPILQAGMSWASSNAALPLAVSRAGGLGVIAAGPMRLPALAEAIDAVREGTDRPFAVNIPLYRQGADEVLDLLEEKRVPILIASQGGPKKYLERFKGIGTTCLHVVASEEHALKAAGAGVDGLIVVGGEAGGHPPTELVSTLVVTRAVVRALAGAVPVVASGGFADGAGLAAALSLGAGAANFGTLFMATPEAGLHPAYKQAVIAASSTDTRTVGRGFGMIRTLSNPFAERMAQAEAAGMPAGDRRALFAAGTLKMAALDGDVAEGKVEAGQSVGLVRLIEPAGDVVRRITAEYLAARAGLPGSDAATEPRDAAVAAAR